MYEIYAANAISPQGNALWTEDYQQTKKLENAHAIMVRSADLHSTSMPESLLAIARAGAGVNNIPLEKCAGQGIVVFNTPGANANSVMELALCGMLLGSRDIAGGIAWVKANCQDPEIAKRTEKEKSRFAGHEIRGKNLGVIGLGAIGGPLANAARRLGMQVYGYDPYISIDAAWHLDSHVLRVKTLEEIFQVCDIITVHVPLMDSTRHMIGKDSLAKMKDGVLVLNFARDQLVDENAMADALASGKVSRYITDFPTPRTANMPGCIAIPHLGASTGESEDNCAKMAVRQVMNYLENGNIVNSVNYPNCDMGICASQARITLLHKNIPNSLSQFTAVMASENINIAGLMNKSRGEYAYTMLDLDHKPSIQAVEKLQQISGVIRVRVIC